MKSTGTLFCQVSLPPATKLGQGYIFTGVCDSVHGGGGVCLSASWDTTPPTRHPPGNRHTHPHPGTDTPPRSRPPGSRNPPGSRHPPVILFMGGVYLCMLGCHPPDQAPPGSRPPRSRHPPRADTPSPWSRQPPPPRHRACWEMWSTRGRYVSYWNAILFYLTLHELGRGVYPPPHTHTHSYNSLLPEFRISIDDR